MQNYFWDFVFLLLLQPGSSNTVQALGIILKKYVFVLMPIFS